MWAIGRIGRDQAVTLRTGIQAGRWTSLFGCLFPRRWEGTLRTGLSFGRDFFVTFWTRDKRHGGNSRSNYFTRFPNTSVKILQESKVDTETTKLDVSINAGMCSSLLNQIGDEVEGPDFLLFSLI